MSGTFKMPRIMICEGIISPLFLLNYAYLGSFTLNFSKGASTVLGQYYNLIRLGREGYTSIMVAGMMNAEYLRCKIRETGLFTIVDKGHMPLVAFSMKDTSKFTLFDIQDKMKGNGWVVPAYTCSHGASNLTIMRIVVKQNFSCDVADMLIRDLLRVIDYLTIKNSTLPDGRLKSAKETAEKLEKSFALKKKRLHSHTTHSHCKKHRTTGEKTHAVC